MKSSFSTTRPSPIKEYDRRWLIATMSAAKNIQRRMIIRGTWQRLYHSNTPFISKFFVARVDDIWATVIHAENETYGDIIELTHLEEKAEVAKHYKPLEFWVHVAETEPERYDFLSKIDDDSFLDARAFWEGWLKPALDAEKAKETVWARTLPRDGYTFPGGQMYTLTNDLMKRAARLYKENPRQDEEEDVLIARLLFEAGDTWEHIDMPSTMAYDYQARDLLDPGQAWARKGADLTLWEHAVGPGSVNPHKMKKDEDYLKVAACWDENGYLRERPTKPREST
ncbi:hypothetical protein CC78DRAFT_523335 [Lojkania enalia]|uniref:Hexosyltransferase n=1 Tax=Lojkania enalia TaxID=147567 RepID=A0A9P4K5C8_9PLEO|nr:hypothetical protein CC78DRAFT_523335 [Didymosphaeria enalia]